MTLPLPEIEGKYEILDRLKEGGMGAIYKVRHRLLGEVRVIKVIRPQLEDEEELKARFLREARMGIQLRHPHIAQLYDFSMDESGTAYMVMEFIDGFTLQGMVQRLGPLPVAITLEVARQALRALGYLHQQGVVHRDISPDNLMLTRDVEGAPLIKLIDLGIAKGLKAGAEANLTATGMFLGKIRYAAPEQFQTGGGMDGRADLYSFGVVLYEVLTGRYPIAGDSPPSIIAGHLFEQPLDFVESDPEGRLPSELRDTILRCLRKKPDERFADAQELGERFEALQHTLAATAPPDFEALMAAMAEGTAATRILPPVGSTAERVQAQFPGGPTPAPTAQGVPAVPPPVVPTPPIEATPTPTPPQATGTLPPARPWYQRPAALSFTCLGMLLALGTVALGGWFLWQRSDKITDLLGTAEPTAIQTTGEGIVVLNALPWGEVVAIVDADGVTRGLPPSPYTPMRLALPPGTYRITVRHPARSQAQEVEVEVVAGRSVRAVVRVHDPEVKPLLEALGW